MSMIMQYVRIRDDELAALRRLLPVDADGAYEYVDELADGDDDGAAPHRCRSMDTDKTWAAMYYLLEQVGPPPVDVVHGGVPLTADEWGYEPPRYLDPREVATAASYLHATPFDRLASAFDPVAMRELYPHMWDSDAGALDYVRGWYEPLTAFFVDAAVHRDGMVIYLT